MCKIQTFRAGRFGPVARRDKRLEPRSVSALTGDAPSGGERDQDETEEGFCARVSPISDARAQKPSFSNGENFGQNNANC